MAIGTTIFSLNVFSLENGKISVVQLAVMIVSLGILLVFIRKSYYDIRAGIPSDDERTKKVRMYAAGYAYFISLYVWILLLGFKQYLDVDDLLLIGLFGMAISFYLSWALLNREKDID